MGGSDVDRDLHSLGTEAAALDARGEQLQGCFVRSEASGEPALVGDDTGFNSRAIRAAEIPGAGGVATARALAAIWSATITPTHGIRLLDDATIELATQVRSEGPPVWNVPGPWPRWGMGFQLDSEARRYLTPQSFGHDGAGGQVAFADPSAQIGFAYLTNQMEAIDDQRATRIIDELRRIVSAPRGS